MKKRILSILLIALLPLLLLTGCTQNKENKINMTRYFTSCSYTLTSAPSNSVTGKLSSYLEDKPVSMNKYSTLSLKGDTTWLYGMTIEYLTFEIYSNASGEFEVEIKLTNVTRGDNEQDPTNPDKEFDKLFSWTVDANKSKLVKININDTIKSISAETNLTFIFNDTPNTNYTIKSIQLYGYHK